MINVIIIIYNNYDLRKKKAADELIITLYTGHCCEHLRLQHHSCNGLDIKQ